MALREGRPWEHGSELTLPWLTGGTPVPRTEQADWPWREARLYGSGRDALRALLRFGGGGAGWRRLWVPSYLCQEVVAAAREEIELVAYTDRPGLSLDQRRFPAAFRSGDAVYLVNTFGLRNAAWALHPPGVTIIEDHTHDPWSTWARTSDAHYALASLRKTLPLPDGAALWSPKGQALPQSQRPTEERQHCAEAKFAGQALKALYLAGRVTDKQVYRDLCLKGESHIASGDPSGMSDIGRALMPNFPTESWRDQRRKNFARVSRETLPRGHYLLQPDAHACPFALVLRCPSKAAREALRGNLIANAVYPAVLWPLDEPAVAGIDRQDVELSERLLSIHCDYRYDADHMSTLITVLHSAIGGA